MSVEEHNDDCKSSKEETSFDKSNEEISLPLSKDERVSDRLRQLRQNMNRARQLNNKALREEGETLGDSISQKQRKSQPESSNGGIISKCANGKFQAKLFAASEPIDHHLVTEPAFVSLDRMLKKDEINELNQFEVNDYHNPEGQYRNYLRNVRSINTYEDDVIGNGNNQEKERVGARRLASEMIRRIEKQNKRARKQTAKEISENKNVSHINQRNKRFNEKINRTYDEQTAEIRDNLERGTAL